MKTKKVKINTKGRKEGIDYNLPEKNTIKGVKEKKIEKAKKIIIILGDIFSNSGYSCYFKNVNIDLIKKRFIITPISKVVKNNVCK